MTYRCKYKFFFLLSLQFSAAFCYYQKPKLMLEKDLVQLNEYIEFLFSMRNEIGKKNLILNYSNDNE